MDSKIKTIITNINNSPNAFFAVRAVKDVLLSNGFAELKENNVWKIKDGGKYFVARNDSSLIAFHMAKEIENYHFQIVSSHLDSPCFRIKENAEIEVKGKYLQLNTEGYGGMICGTWLDRPLSIAGRVVIKNNGKLQSRYIDFKKDMVIIPSLAIHMNRKVNEDQSFNKQIDMLPLFGDSESKKGDLKKLIASELNVTDEDIISTELYLYNNQSASVWGTHSEFISSPRLDDLEGAFSSLEAFISTTPNNGINVLACFDNEEVGSTTKQGAASTFLRDTLRRINTCLEKTKEDYYIALANSFMISLDNAHAVHPNHPEKTDATNCAYLNEGIVIKTHSGQKYTTDSVSMALFEEICKKAEVPYQLFFNRSDELGGSTLGNISSSQVSVNCVDIGLPQLAMHSSYETAGTKDISYLIKALSAFYDTTIYKNAEGDIELG